MNGAINMSGATWVKQHEWSNSPKFPIKQKGSVAWRSSRYLLYLAWVALRVHRRQTQECVSQRAHQLLRTLGRLPQRHRRGRCCTVTRGTVPSPGGTVPSTGVLQQMVHNVMWIINYVVCALINSFITYIRKTHQAVLVAPSDTIEVRLFCIVNYVL